MPPTLTSPALATAEASGAPTAESLLLDAMHSADELFTVSRLCATTGLEPDAVRDALAGLRDRGRVAKLNTLIESWVPRSPDGGPLTRLDDGDASPWPVHPSDRHSCMRHPI